MPTVWREREALREKGQFWTPPWLAETMAAWVTAKAPPVLFDPAVGPGTFFAAARSIGYTGAFAGFELHAGARAERDPGKLGEVDFEQVTTGDFMRARIGRRYPAIISNPPFIRHHRLTAREKIGLRARAARWLGFPPDGRAGLHLYFLLKSLELLDREGRLAFVLPADVCEGVSAGRVWARICGRFCAEAVLTFAEEAAPFPQVDTNAMVFLLSNRPPAESLLWVRVRKRDPQSILSALRGPGARDATVVSRPLSEALSTGFSRPPRPELDGLPLSSFAKVVRGIATGANEFFFLTRKQVRERSLSERHFARAIGRTRDCRESVLTREHLEGLEARGRATWLLKLGAEPKAAFPAALRDYLEAGEEQGLPGRSLLRTRRPWYKMEHRAPPPLLFAYLGRRDCRFVLNRARALPLTGFLCVYPFDDDPEAVERLWRALNHPDTLPNLAFAAKSYGSGALKAEPRQLDRLLIPSQVLEEAGLLRGKKTAMRR
ncbi:MAG TPA: N-6 DNA methylase [Dongiaceae bacterium]|nr:N-6 DNA methylase [Dongiaceae bacterium]